MLTLHIQSENGRFFAQCPELDISGNGITRQGAFNDLCEELRLNAFYLFDTGRETDQTRLIRENVDEPINYFGTEQLAKHGLA